jgi:N-acetylglutamate synthase-like GNAT family acetyltransferase
MEIIVRQYDPSDLDECRRLWVELVEHHRTIYNDQSIGGNKPGLYFDSHLTRIGSDYIWVAEYDGEVVGVTGLIVSDGEAEIDPLVVSAKHRGKGIGKTLVKLMIEEAKKLGVRYLSVKPVARNTDAIAFYHNAGFRGIGQIELFMEPQDFDSEKWKHGIELFGHFFVY